MVDLKEAYLEAKFDILLAIAEFPPSLKNLERGADLEDYLNDTLFNILDDTKEMERLNLT